MRQLDEKHDDLKLSAVVTALSSLGKSDLPAQLARWLDQLDETGRWALLKLVTGGLRIGVSARLAKTAAAAIGDKDPHEIELLWPGLRPPYVELFAWLEGRGEAPANRDPAPFRPAMLAHAMEDGELDALDPSEFLGEWKWDGIRVQAVAGVDEHGQIAPRLYSRTGEDISGSFPEMSSPVRGFRRGAIWPCWSSAGHGLDASAVRCPLAQEFAVGQAPGPPSSMAWASIAGRKGAGWRFVGASPRPSSQAI